MYDLDKLHKDHVELFKDVIAMRAYSGLTDEQIQEIYNIYADLNKIPKKDWNKYKPPVVVDE